MYFYDDEAEEYYKRLLKEYGYFHLNQGKYAITVEELKEIENCLLEINASDNK